MKASIGRETLWRSLLGLALGGWIGAWGFFAFVVSRLAFRILPGNVAGDLAGALLRILHLGGATAAAIIAVSLVALGRRGWVVYLPIALGLVALGSEQVLSPQIAALRPSTLGASSTEATQSRFGLLHGLSLGLFMSVHLASIALLGWISWLETRDRRPPGSDPS